MPLHRFTTEHATLLVPGPRTRETVMVRTRSGVEVPRPGEWVDGTPTRSALRVAVYPVQQERQLPIEGVRFTDLRTFYTETELRIDENAIIEWAGESWRIIEAKDWGRYRELTASRRGL